MELLHSDEEVEGLEVVPDKVRLLLNALVGELVQRSVLIDNQF